MSPLSALTKDRYIHNKKVIFQFVHEPFPRVLKIDPTIALAFKVYFISNTLILNKGRTIKLSTLYEFGDESCNHLQLKTK